MEIRELRLQEDIARTVASTLRAYWEPIHGVKVSANPPSDGRETDAWTLQPLLSTYFPPGVITAARRFSMDRFRFTPQIGRAPFQWLLGSVAGSRVGISITGKPGFWVTPKLPHSRHVIVVPGSRRLRIFDFQTMRTASVAKNSFNSDSVENELRARNRKPGPFVPIVRSDPLHRWIEEPIVMGYPLPRCPPWWNRHSLEQEALERLTEWSEPIETIATSDYVEGLTTRIRTALNQCAPKYGEHHLTDTSIQRLGTASLAVAFTPLSYTHGDFQPGNIHVSKGSRNVLIIDMEFAGVRQRSYDLLTYGLNVRYPAGLANRIEVFVQSGAMPATSAGRYIPELNDRDWRRAAVALYLLEDLERTASDAATGGYIRTPMGLRALSREIASLENRSTLFSRSS